MYNIKRDLQETPLGLWTKTRRALQIHSRSLPGVCLRFQLLPIGWCCWSNTIHKRCCIPLHISKTARQSWQSLDKRPWPDAAICVVLWFAQLEQNMGSLRYPLTKAQQACAIGSKICGSVLWNTLCFETHCHAKSIPKLITFSVGSPPT